jgi:hypothetical protein
MRVARAHHRTAILEDLHIPDEGQRSQFFILLRPYIDDSRNCRDIHLRQRQVVARRKANDATDAAFASGVQQRRHSAAGFSVAGSIPAGRNIRQQRREVICKHKCMFILRVDRAIRSGVAGTEVARRIVGWTLLVRRLFDLPLPWALRAMRRDQHPFTGQRIESAMWMIGEREH